MSEKEFFNESKLDDKIWILSILALILMNKSDFEKPVINIFLGDE